MAAKTPDSINEYNVGELRLLVAKFITSDIDDNDTWASGIKSIIGVPIWQGVGDNGYDVQITSISDGTITFDAAANSTGYLFIFARGY